MSPESPDLDSHKAFTDINTEVAAVAAYVLSQPPVDSLDYAGHMQNVVSNSNSTSSTTDFTIEYDQCDTINSGLDHADNSGPVSGTAAEGSSQGIHRQTPVVATSDPPRSSQALENPCPSPNTHPLEEAVADEFGLSVTATSPESTKKASTAPKQKEDKDPAPAWSELKTKAGKERKRLPLACIACRRKKIRCSGEKPACKHCLRSRIPCVYKVTTRKAAPRTDYMAMLDKRLKRMEERIIKAVPKSDDCNPAQSVARATVKPSIPGSNTSAKGASATTSQNSKKRPADEAFGHDLDSWAYAPSKSSINSSTSRPPAHPLQDSENDTLFAQGREALPSADIQEHLAEIYFDHVYGQAYYLLHKPSYMRKLRTGTLPPVLILSVCAISARFSTHPKLNTSPNFLRGEEWAMVARDIVTKRYEWPNITTLICLILLGLHEFGTCHGGRSWALGGQAMRMAYALQLHRDLDHDPNGDKPQLSFIDREIRRRTMWACFLMDRFNSSGTDRPMFIREESIKIPLPVKERCFQLDVPASTQTLKGDLPSPSAVSDGDTSVNMGVSAYTVRVIALWGRIITYVNLGGKAEDIHPIFSPDSGYAGLSKEAEDILANLPESLRYSPENIQLHRSENMANQFIFMHIAIQQNILFLSRILLGKPPSPEAAAQTPRSFVTRVGEKAFVAASHISQLLKDADSHFVSAPFAGYCAFSSSTIHILGIFSGNYELEASSKKNLATNVKYLSRMKRYWGMLHWMSENLKEQYRSYSDTKAKGLLTERTPASPIFQYGDWFDQYPHGVANTEFGDLTAKSKQRSDDAVLEQKPDLHTVEEFFTTLTPPQSVDSSQHPAKRKAGNRKGSQATPIMVTEGQQMEHFNAISAPAFNIAQPAPAPAAADANINARLQNPSRFLPLIQTSNTTRDPPMSATSMDSSGNFMSPLDLQTAKGQQFGHSNSNSAIFSPDIFSMSLSRSANIIQPLDRQIVLDAYSTDLGMGEASKSIIGTVNNVNTGENTWDADLNRVTNMGQSNSMAPQTGTNSMTEFDVAVPRGQPTVVSSSNGAVADMTWGSVGMNFGPGASSAWFMPFNTEPPELTQDMGLSITGLESFGGILAGNMSSHTDGLDGLGCNAANEENP
ncbi:putative transcriptional regulatory protein [Ceratocystis fimbriata CBS 114723]|uniref:Putative transcriptional regulatory protein n=1 Tax=Ceratocystis fimbriata CBS 114723 TaxID=1035309 RepID=A0A2C5X332_9PEZI|nr:putative transcriptional regulatory protein [Ceratocystis fimbriata CBS 114723]